MTKCRYTCNACKQSYVFEAKLPSEIEGEKIIDFLGKSSRKHHTLVNPDCNVPGSIDVFVPCIKVEDMMSDDLKVEEQDSEFDNDFRKNFGGRIRTFNHLSGVRIKEYVTENYTANIGGVLHQKVGRLMWAKQRDAFQSPNQSNTEYMIAINSQIYPNWEDNAREKVSSLFNRWAEAGFPYPFPQEISNEPIPQTEQTNVVPVLSGDPIPREVLSDEESTITDNE